MQITAAAVVERAKRAKFENSSRLSHQKLRTEPLHWRWREKILIVTAGSRWRREKVKTLVAILVAAIDSAARWRQEEKILFPATSFWRKQILAAPSKKKLHHHHFGKVGG